MKEKLLFLAVIGFFVVGYYLMGSFDRFMRRHKRHLSEDRMVTHRKNERKKKCLLRKKQ